MMALRLQYMPHVHKHIVSLSQFFYSSVYKTSNYIGVKLASSHSISGQNDMVNSVDEYLTNTGANMEKIHKEVKISELELCERIKSIVDVLEGQCDLELSDVGRMITKRPRILLLDKEKIERCITVLSNTGLKQQNISIILKKSPGILTSRFEETFEEKLETLYNLNVLPPFSMKNVLNIITKCPALISTCTPSSLEAKVDFLQSELGFYRRQLSNMILKQPSILTFSQENIKSKFDYCYTMIGVSIPDIARCPRIWQCSLQRLKERHLYLQHLKLITDQTHVDDYGLGKIVTPSDILFAEEIAKTSLVEFQNFIKGIPRK